jgi:predicted NAD/FAD-binding protein
VKRREIVRLLAGTAGVSALGNSAPAPLRKVGIIGGGMAGVAVAWLLDGQRDIVLLEAQPVLGGNIHEVTVNLDGYSFVVDLGAQYFNPQAYPTYYRLLTTLGLLPETHTFATSITVFDPSEANPRFVSPVLPDRSWPLLAPWNRDGLQAFQTALLSAARRERENADWNVTVEQWLQTLGLSQAQWQGIIAPWIASLFSGSIETALNLSARAAMVFAARALPQNPLEPVPYSVLNPGMAEVLQVMIAQTSTVQVLTGAVVMSAARNPQGGFDLSLAGGGSQHVDDLVLACSGPPALALLTGLTGTGQQQSALAGIEFSDDQLALHTDPIYAPADPVMRSFLNCEIEGAYCEASMWLANVLAVPPPQTAAKLWKSWITHRSQPPAQVIAEAQYKHMVPTPATLQAQAALSALQGQGGVWFAGGYLWPFDSQETALLSAKAAAAGLLGGPAARLI